MRVDLRRPRRRRWPTESPYRPTQVLGLVGATQRQQFTQRRLVDLMTAMPADCKSTVSSRIASATWLAVSANGWSSRTNDHARIVTGPVNMPFTGLSVSDCA